ncbi:isocitrate lyase/phosphoenolpyruvate mutase family protein [Nitrospirillum sp. BR 11163]|uniref:isocitrate lyase/PEP mutase family protein n=1 Tax=Nitrospirillum sp. BR 11163 TaxID=3104323 RepID=UPI002B00366A|nr:isocitrate lyase/phosphoenolpyruvate mutase family protein [Nitrospirillum sp. BR 11163]MEA1671860.1 isocitrate lyase/phosphoenolpyruvate mutase family protein [Nitrospirillum sp. BR 11163]
MTRTITEKRAAFRALHQDGCFLLPNPWDVGSARLLQHLGFKALATTSSGYAWTQGRPDYGVTRDEVLEHLRALAPATDLPVNADYEFGFAHEISDLATNVRLAVEAGVAGLSVEDIRADGQSGHYDTATAVERVRAARDAIDAVDPSAVLVARTEILLADTSRVAEAIDKMVALADAGADCLYAPGLVDKADVVALVRAVAPKPVNLLVMRPGPSLAEIADWGVRRISVGGGLARAAWGGFLRAAEELRAGSFDGLAAGASGKQLNDVFGGFSRA